MFPQLSYFPPSPALRGLVSLHYVFRSNAPVYTDRLGALLPQTQLLLSGTCTYRVGDGPPLPAPDVALIGPSNAAVTIEGRDHHVVLGTGLLPAGWALLARFAAAEIANDRVEGGAIWGDGPAERFLDAARSAPDDARRAEIADAFHRRLFERAARAADPRIAAVDRWLSAPGRHDIGALADEIGLSQRQLERLTAATHGAAPAQLALKYRTLRAAARMAVGDAPDWMAAAGEDYTDQAHFIRCFNRFVGATPGAFLKGRAPLARGVIMSRWAAGVREPIALWS
ncbi:helix-turn-helix domain-containing protein [Sphingomonas lenta]|uniref:HTH araC/xylS-type domain-containing protein n=1 Tax=Sphingomonas lenta TaxID=1141887 RepID=A0A2A2SG29_9SPHN|nr:AraC family transcriptional regulator [Sphingomonas lenta]PAX08165.1 hypothetical protein CKY28_11345 [Sphingomonas lenta]